MEKEKGRLLHIRIDESTYEKLRLVSYQSRQSMSSLVREAVDKLYGASEEGEEKDGIRQVSG